MKYHYALNPSGEIVSIHDVKENGGIYNCPSCRSRLIAKIGQHREHHFAHKGSFHCSLETYLHLLAKRLFEQAYAIKEPIYLNWTASDRCTHKDANNNCTRYRNHSIDLMARYPYLEVEKRDGAFIPDILLSDGKGDKVYIEFANTHYSSDDKKKSGIKIVEIGIRKESDIEKITKSRIINACDNVELFGFNTGSFNCAGHCISPRSTLHIEISVSSSPRPAFNNLKSPLLKKGDYGYHYVNGFEFLMLKSSHPYSAYIKDTLFMDTVLLGQVKYEVYIGKSLIGITSTKEGAIKIAEVFASESDALF